MACAASPVSVEVRESLAALRSLSSVPLDGNDLGRLAQMHSHAQILAEHGGSCCELARALAEFFERTILNETSNAAAGLGATPRAIVAMELAIDTPDADLKELVDEIRAASTGAAPGSTPAQSVAATAAPLVAAAAPSAPIEEYVSEPLVVDLSEREHLQGFIDESREHMDAIEAALLTVEAEPHNTDRVNDLFRPFHTIKGIAGFLNLRDVNRLTHEVETILDMGRRGEMTITAATIDLIFAAIDALKTQISAIAQYLTEPSGASVPQPDIRALMRLLRAAAAGSPAPVAASAPVAPQASPSCSGTAFKAEPPVASGQPAPRNEELHESAPDRGDAGRAQAADLSIRVDTNKLDALVDAVGELVIAQTMVNLNGNVRLNEKLTRDVSQVTKIVRDVQETAMAMRMVPIGPSFQKMKRLVRDVSRKAGKQVELRISGEDTELDKNVAQAISDPLVHMVRNSVDHGIEPADARVAAGKNPVGVVHLKAYYQGDCVVMEIADDGRGLDRERILRKARERGIVGPDQQLSDDEIHQLIFAPGFSTAEQITDISGRGVGMDVVRRNIEQLRGKIEIENQPGQGATIRVRLPLTLAIIDGMLVRVGAERLIIPTIHIEQSLRPAADQITLVQRCGEMIRVRGQLISLVQLGSLFGYSQPIDPSQALVVILLAGTQKIGLVCDELIGQQQVVIKTLGDRFKHLRGISGAAILGDGRVGLILEPAGLLALHNSSPSVSGRLSALRARDEATNEDGAADRSGEPVAAWN